MLVYQRVHIIACLCLLLDPISPSVGVSCPVSPRGLPSPLVQFSVLVDGVFCGGLTILHLHPLNQTTQKMWFGKRPTKIWKCWSIIVEICLWWTNCSFSPRWEKNNNFPGPSGRAFCWDQTRPWRNCAQTKYQQHTKYCVPPAHISVYLSIYIM